MQAFTALADPTRRSIVEMLARSSELSARHIGEQFTISAPAISQHLKILREAGLVQVRAEAQQRFYQVKPEGLREIEDWLKRTQWFLAQHENGGG